MSALLAGRARIRVPVVTDGVFCRSPSPEPIYNSEGKRLNTREYRTRKRLEEDRHRFIQEAMNINEEFKPPADYK